MSDLDRKFVSRHYAVEYKSLSDVIYFAIQNDLDFDNVKFGLEYEDQYDGERSPVLIYKTLETDKEFEKSKQRHQRQLEEEKIRESLEYKAYLKLHQKYKGGSV